MKPRVAPLLLASLAAGCGSSRYLPEPAGAPGASAPPVVIDGETGEWAGVPAYATSRVTPPSGADLLDVSTRHDAAYVYLRLRFARPVSLLALGGTLSIIVNADDSEWSGQVMAGVLGADFIVDFSPRDSLGRPAQGASVRLLGPGVTEVRRDPYALDLVALPTHAAADFELRLARGRPLGASSGRSFTGDRYVAQVITLDERGKRTDGHRAFTARLRTPYREPATPSQPTDPLARPSGTALRAVQWNVADAGLVERPQHFRRVIRALDPDILVLDEVADDLGRAGMERFLSEVDSGRSRAPWSFTFGGGGGYQRTVVASRNAVTELPGFRRIAFPDTAVERLLAMAPAAARDRLRANLAEGVAAGGARVRVGGRELVVVGIDLQSAGNDSTSWQEARRRVEARLIARELSRAVSGTEGAGGAVGADGIIVAGDLNLVGTELPLSILRDSTGLRLRVAPARQLDGRTTATWDGRDGPFPPGRLDWFLARGLAPIRAVAFETRDVDPRWLLAHGLHADDTHRASDHLPVVVDLTWEP